MENEMDVKLQIREEQLEVSKEKIKTAEVSIYRELITEEQSFTVPVSREELVIRKKLLDPEMSQGQETQAETIRIPIWEEQVEVSARPVELNQVEIYQRKYVENEHIEENLRRETLNVEISGDVRVKKSEEWT